MFCYSIACCSSPTLLITNLIFLALPHIYCRKGYHHAACFQIMDSPKPAGCLGERLESGYVASLQSDHLQTTANTSKITATATPMATAMNLATGTIMVTAMTMRMTMEMEMEMAIHAQRMMRRTAQSTRNGRHCGKLLLLLPLPLLPRQYSSLS